MDYDLFNLYEFVWPVARGGHKWITGVTLFEDMRHSGDATNGDKGENRATGWLPRPFLMPITMNDEEVRATYPLRELKGRLHREFARTPPTLEGIKKFADEFGLLGGDIGETPVVDVGGPHSPIGPGEGFSDWAVEISRMAEAVEFWDLARKNDTKRLSDLIHWREDSVALKLAIGYRRIAASNFRTDLFEQVQPGDLVEPAMFVVQEIVNDHLSNKARAGPRLLWDVKQRTLSQRVTPRALIGAIWLDFLLAIDGNTDYRPCLRCDAPFPVTPKGQRRKFCSDRCRVAHHRKKRNQGGSP